MLFLVFVLNFSLAFSQSNFDKMKKLVSEKEYVQAESLITSVSSENTKDFAAQSLCGDIYFELESYEKALKSYQIALKINENSEIRRKIATTYSMLNNFTEAYKVINQSIKDDAKDALNYLTLADILLAENEVLNISANENKSSKISENIVNVELNVSKAKKIDSKNPRAYLMLGNMYFSQGVYELAKTNYEEALKFDENLHDARAKLATSYYWMGNRESDQTLSNEYFNLSLAEWNKLTKLDPKNAKAFYEQGRLFFLGKKYENAARSLNQYAALRPDGVLGRWMLAQSFVEIRKCDSAETHLDFVSKNLDSVKLKSKFLLARCSYDNKNYKKASALYNELQKDTTFDFVDSRKQATASLFSGDTVNAVNMFRNVVAKFPENACTINDLVGRLLFSSKKYDEALYFITSRLNNSKCSDSNDAKQYYFGGISYFNLAIKDSSNPELKKLKLDSAKNYLTKAISLDSNYINAMVNLASVYEAQGDEAGSESLIDKSISLASKDTLVYKQVLQQAFFKICGSKLTKKKYQELQKYSKLWIEVLPSSAYGYLYLAVSYQGMSEKDEACKNYKKCLQIDPNNGTAKSNYEKLCK